MVRWVQVGWNVVHTAGDSAIVESTGGRVNHVLHLLLTLVTAGLWAFVWIVIAVSTPGARRLMLTVQPDGEVSVTGPNGRPVNMNRERFWRQGPGLAIIIVGLLVLAVVCVGALNA